MNSQNKDVSSLSDHRLHKKQGIIATPLNDGLRDILTLSSWTRERMPEYIWLGLILLHYGRKKGLKKAAYILYNISKEINSLSHPKLSMIFGLPEEEQNKVFKIIVNLIDKDILSPLTVLYRSVKFPLFNEFFNNPQLKYESRVQQLIEAVRVYSPPQADEATDLRFLALCLWECQPKIDPLR